MKSRVGILPLIACAICLSSLVGCGGSVSQDQALAEANKTRIQRLANCYSMYQASNSWMGPENEEVFKKFLRDADPARMERMGVSVNDIDSLFVSERDNEPFQIRYEIQGSPRGCAEPAIFEAAGSGGKRMVAFLNMSQKEVEELEYDQLWEGGEQSTSVASRADGPRN